jgi:hypothetical protein
MRNLVARRIAAGCEFCTNKANLPLFCTNEAIRVRDGSAADDSTVSIPRGVQAFSLLFGVNRSFERDDRGKISVNARGAVGAFDQGRSEC